MSTLGIYTILEVIKKNEHRSIYRVKDNQGTSYILKRSHNVGYGHSDGIRIRREYQLCKMFDVPNIIKVIDQGTLEGAPYITYEDFGGSALKAMISNSPLELSLFYKLALEMISAVLSCHGMGLVHRDVNSNNFIVSKDMSKIKLADFGISDEISQFANLDKGQAFFQGTLDYIAPEQTGRVALPIDFRTDLYSLGATFFEMLTGTTPFDTKGCDIAESIFIHLTHVAHPVSRLNPSVPKVLSDLVAKLLAKDPEERYQSIFGVREDMTRLKLMHDREQYQYFEVGLRDITPIFRPSSDLLSRWELFDEIIPGGSIGLIDKPRYQLIKGRAKSGKTTIIEAIGERYTQHGRDIIEIRGNKEQSQRPYGAIELALENWLEKAINSSVDEAHLLRDKLISAIGPNLGLITRTFKALDNLVGNPSILESVNPQENKMRFNQAVVELFNIMKSETGSLLILIDDLNHLDDATIRLLIYLLNSQLQFVDCIGSHNSQFESESAAFLELIESIPFIQHTIEPFSLEDVEGFIKQGFQWDLGTNQALSEILYDKTHGNPGHLIDIIESAVKSQIIYFDFLSGRWHFNVNRQSELGLAPNVLEYQVEKFEKLDVIQKERIELATLLPRKFLITRLLEVENRELIEFLQEITQLIELGFFKSSHYILDILIQDGMEQKFDVVELWFADDDFKQYMYERMSKSKHKSNHLLLGQQLFIGIKDQLHNKHARSSIRVSIEEEIRYHFNACDRDKLSDDQRNELIQLNYDAALASKRSVAYDAALNEAQNAVKAFTAGEIKNMTSLAFDVLLLEAELLYLTRDFFGSEKAFSELVKSSQNDMQKISINRLRLQLYINQGETHKVIDLASETLELLKYPFKENLSIPIVVGQLIKLQFSKYITEPSRITTLKSCNEEEVKMILEVLNLLISVSYLLSKVLFIRIILAMLSLSLTHGMMRLTPFAFATYGIVEVGLFKRYTRALAIGKASLEAAKRTGDWEVLSKVNFTIGFFINHWVTHVRESIDFLIDGKEQSRLSGNMVYYAYNSAALMLARVAISDNLNDVYQAAKQDLMHPDILTDKDVSNLLVAVREYAASLIKLDRDHFFDEQQFEIELRNSNMPSILAHHLILKMKRSYLIGDYTSVIYLGEDLKSLLGELMGLYISVEAMYYTALAYLKLRKKAEESNIGSVVYVVNYSKLKREMKRLKGINPKNFAHKYEHINAVQMWYDGRITQAHLEFHNALRSAHEQGFLLEQGLISEDLSNYYIQCNQMRLSDVFIRESYVLFRQLECYIKCDVIKSSVVHISFEKVEQAMFDTYQTRTLFTQTNQEYESQIIVKGMQFLCVSVNATELQRQITRLALEVSGAQKCVLILQRENLEVIAQMSHGEFKLIDPYESIQLSKRIPAQIIQFSSRSKEPVVLSCAHDDFIFSRDAYVKLHRVKSTLCVPMWFGDRPIGLIYLENNLLTNAFEKVRLDLLQVLAHQFALAHEHCELKHNLLKANQELIKHEDNLGSLVRERTYELSKTKQEIETLLNEVGQGFLSINVQGMVNTLFSRECLHIFGHDITDEPFHSLLQNHDRTIKSRFYQRCDSKGFRFQF